MARALALALALAVGSGGCSPASSGGLDGMAVAAEEPAAPTSTLPPTTVTSVPTSTAAAAIPAPVAWTPCGRYECGTISVPLDHAQPAGRHIVLAVDRRKATDQAHRIGSVLVNPGGPGVSGYDALGFIAGRLPKEVTDRFDVVAFDPRGVGRSSPVRCLSSADLGRYLSVDPTPDTPAEEQALVEATTRLVAGCQKMSGDLLAHVGTADAARDMDLIRIAVGDPKLTYVGFSYGTSLGSTYAALFPDKVRALVLDGAVDPLGGVDDINRVQGEGFDRAFKDFADDCRAKGVGCTWQPPEGPGPAAFTRLAADVDARPRPAGKRTLGPAELFLGAAAALYAQSRWPLLARALQEAEKGIGSTLVSMSDGLTGRGPNGTYDNSQEANAAINCIDRPAPRAVADYERAAQAASTDAPLFGPAIAWSGLVCGLWPVAPVGTATPPPTVGAPPILVIGTTNDPATPYEWAQSMNRQISGSRLLTHVGEGHTVYGANGCVDAVADGYLLRLELPAGELRC